MVREPSAVGVVEHCGVCAWASRCLGFSVPVYSPFVVDCIRLHIYAALRQMLAWCGEKATYLKESCCPVSTGHCSRQGKGKTEHLILEASFLTLDTHHQLTINQPCQRLHSSRRGQPNLWGPPMIKERLSSS